MAAGALGPGVSGASGAGMDGLANRQDALDPIRHRHFVRRRGSVLSRRVDQPVTPGPNPIYPVKGAKVDIRFACPVCEQPAQRTLPGHGEWQCPACDQRLQFEGIDAALPACLLCGNQELYKKKDFPHWLGLIILTVACLASIIPYWQYHQWLTWTILLGSAAVDGLLYLWVGNVIVCYRCEAHYRELIPDAEHKPF